MYTKPSRWAPCLRGRVSAVARMAPGIDVLALPIFELENAEVEAELLDR